MITIHFSPIESLPDVVIKPQGPVSKAFLDRGITTFHQAAYYVKNMPYGYNKSADDAMILFNDGFVPVLPSTALWLDLQKSWSCQFTAAKVCIH
jgi:hypothetical protein